MNSYGLPLVITLTTVLTACTTSPTKVAQLASHNTACELENIRVTELDARLPHTRRYETVGCGTTHNYVCPTWATYAMNALNLYAMSASDDLISVDDPTHCQRERR